MFRRDLPANEVRCDIAERKSIADYRAYGINAVGASSASPVADGIVWLKGARAHRDRPPPRALRLPGVRPLPRPPRQRGAVSAGYPDKDNHAIDVRYAVFDLIADPDTP